MPYARAGQAIGLYGGSFDPPHAAHVRNSLQAIKRLGLDELWWLVSPGNPLKEHGPSPVATRISAARKLVRHPRAKVTDIEAQLGTRYSADTIAALHRLYPGVRFVWVMGADNLAQFHRWQNWRQIMETTPIAALARPGERLAARLSVAARTYRTTRVPERAAWTLTHRQAPAWCFLNQPMSTLSSTDLRNSADPSSF